MIKSRLFRITFAVITTMIIAIVIATTGYPSALKYKEPSYDNVLIKNVNLISMKRDTPELQSGMSIFVQNGIISEISTTADIQTYASTHIIDGTDKYLLPGLIDAHVHVWDEAELAGYLAHGVTGIRNMSGMPFHLPLQRRIQNQKLLGPDFTTTGPILNSPGPNQQANHILITTAEEARTEVQKQHKKGYRTLKVYSNLNRPAYQAISDEAKRLDLKIVGHTPEGIRTHDMPHDKQFNIPFKDILDDNFQTIEHVESIVWHGMRDNLDKAGMVQLAKDMAKANVAVTPTLIAHENLVRVAESKGNYANRPEVKTVNPFLTYIDKNTIEFWSHHAPLKHEQIRADFYLIAAKFLYDEGVTIVAGTDAGIFVNVPGSALTRELELYVEAGLTPYQALTTATRNAANVLEFSDTGTIEIGKKSNLVLLSSNPLENISALEFPNAVMVGNTWLDQDKLKSLDKAAHNTSFLRSARRALEMILAS